MASARCLEDFIVLDREHEALRVFCAKRLELGSVYDAVISVSEDVREVLGGLLADLLEQADAAPTVDELVGEIG